MRVRFCFVLMVLLHVLITAPAHAEATSAELAHNADMLKNVIPRDLIPASYGNVRPPTTLTATVSAHLWCKGPSPLGVQIYN